MADKEVSGREVIIQDMESCLEGGMEREGRYLWGKRVAVGFGGWEEWCSRGCEIGIE